MDALPPARTLHELDLRVMFEVRAEMRHCETLSIACLAVGMSGMLAMNALAATAIAETRRGLVLPVVLGTLLVGLFLAVAGRALARRCHALDAVSGQVSRRMAQRLSTSEESLVPGMIDPDRGSVIDCLQPQLPWLVARLGRVLSLCAGAAAIAAGLWLLLASRAA